MTRIVRRRPARGADADRPARPRLRRWPRAMRRVHAPRTARSAAAPAPFRPPPPQPTPRTPAGRRPRVSPRRPPTRVRALFLQGVW